MLATLMNSAKLFFFYVFLIMLLFPRHSGWEFQKRLLLYYLRSHCSPTGLMLLWLISEVSHRLQRQHAEMAAERFENPTLLICPVFKACARAQTPTNVQWFILLMRFTLPPSAWYSFSSAPSSFASPKSVIFTCWGVLTRTFLAARSRCTRRRSSK